MSERKPSSILKLYAILAYLYLYFPIIILVIFSFNTQRLNIQWEGFTLAWYRVLITDSEVLLATRNTLLIAFFSTIVATILGTLTALGLHRYRFPGYRLSESALYIPVIIPEVVMGIGLLVFFSLIRFKLGLVSIALSHIAFSIPFVALVVRARLHGYDKVIEEAAMDLGANEAITFFRITLPTILPGILAGALLAFTLSLDDYVITFFTAGPGSTTLPLRIYSMVRHSVTPEINALSTIWVFSVFIVLWLGHMLQKKQNN